MELERPEQEHSMIIQKKQELTLLPQAILFAPQLISLNHKSDQLNTRPSVQGTWALGSRDQFELKSTSCQFIVCNPKMDYPLLYELLPKPPIQWQLNQLQLWLSFIGLQSLHQSFKQHSVDGSVVMDLDEIDFREEIGVKSSITLKKLMTWVETGLREYTQFVRAKAEKREAEHGGQTILNSKNQRRRENKQEIPTMKAVKQPESFVRTRSLPAPVYEEEDVESQKKLMLGCIIDEAEAMCYEVNMKGASVGSNSFCTIVLKDPCVKALHAEIFCDESKNFCIQDTGSIYGTYIGIEGRHRVSSGMLIEVGSSLLELELLWNFLKIKVIEGSHVGTQFLIRNFDEKIVIGRKASNVIALPLDLHLSNYHSQIYRIHEVIYVQDLGATNGTWERLSIAGVKSCKYTIHNGSTLKIGANNQFTCKIKDPAYRILDSAHLKTLTCRSCQLSTRNCLFLPCKHVSHCIGCGENESHCPVCQVVIESKTKIFEA